MSDSLFYSIASSPAALHCIAFLSKHGIPFTDHPNPDATHLLLNVPSHHSDFTKIISSLPEQITIIGGGLPNSALTTHKCFDLLADEYYLYKNAYITAECALSVLMQNSNRTLHNGNVLIIGYGRITRHLSKLLSSLQANIFILSKSVNHRAEASSLGFGVFSPNDTRVNLLHFDFIVNTAPEVILSDTFFIHQADAIKIDLASAPGILTPDVIRARGLPGRMVPISSGELIADTILAKLKEGVL